MCGCISIYLCACWKTVCVRIKKERNEEKLLQCKKGKELAHSVVVCAVDVSGHSKVSDLDQQVLPYQAVPCSQVSVDEVLRGQVHHASSDLLGDVQHLGLGELHQDVVVTI